MKLTPPTNMTFGFGIIFGIIGLSLGIFQGISLPLIVVLIGLLFLVVGNLYEKI